MQDRVLGNPKVQLHTNVIIEDILGELEPVKKVVGVRLKNTVEDNTYELPLDGIFIAIGHKPNSDLFRGVLDMDESGYLKTVPGSSKTNIPGVFACGDIQDSIYRQAITAAGSGCMAAIDAERFLSGGHG
jgi:thioredoxin reductase (NADPH)